MTADTGTLTTVLTQFLDVFKMGRGNVAGSAWSLLTTLAAIELILASLWWALTGQDAIVALIKKILTIGFFIFVVQNYDSLLHTVIEGFIQTGKTASSSGGDSLASVRDPSTIIDAGFFVALPILEHLQSFSEWDVLFHIHDIIITGLCGLGILGAYFIIAIQVFVTYLEFAIVSTLGLIFIPFGVFRHTRFLAEKAFGSIIAFGIKLMVLGLLVSVTVPVLNAYSLPADPTWTQLFNMLVLCFAIAGLAWHAPGVAAGLLSGGPSLTAGTAGGTALAGAAAGIGGAMAAHSVVHPPLSATASTATGALSALPLADAGFRVAARNAELSGGSALRQMSAGLLGATATVGKQAAQAALHPAVVLKENLKSFVETNQMRVPGYEALRAQQATAPMAGASAAVRSEKQKEEIPQGKILKEGKESPETARTLKAAMEKVTVDEDPKLAGTEEKADKKSKVTQKKASISKVSMGLHLAKESMPHTAHPSGSIQVPLQSEEENK